MQELKMVNINWVILSGYDSPLTFCTFTVKLFIPSNKKRACKIYSRSVKWKGKLHSGGRYITHSMVHCSGGISPLTGNALTANKF